MQREWQDPDDAITPEALRSTERVELKRALPFEGVLYVERRRSHEPAWIQFVNSGLDAPLGRVRSAAPSALVVIHASDHLFALSFGHGRHFIRDERVERDFGLRVVLNTVDSASLRSVDMRTLDETMVLTRRQATRASSIDVFGVDVSRDMLRAVTGRPTSTSLGSRITGADRVSVALPIAVPDLGALCADLLTAYGLDTYRQNFAWIDKLRLVRSADLTAVLDELLIQTMTSSEFSRLRLAAPDLVDPDRAAGYRYSVEAAPTERHDELEVADYLAAARAKRGETPTLERLKSDHAVVVDSNELPIQKWTIYRAIALDLEYGGSTYALADGQWYQIDNSFASAVTAQIDALDDADFELPPMAAGEREDAYLARVAPEVSASGIHVELMDKKLARATGANAGVEVCDLLSELGHFVHVKKGDQSSGLSHLFSQGEVSAELFLMDAQFRNQARAHVANTPCDSDDLFLPATLRDHITVVYAVVDRRVGTLAATLPFFSKVNLANRARRLSAMGCRVQTKHVAQL